MLASSVIFNRLSSTYSDTVEATPVWRTTTWALPNTPWAAKAPAWSGRAGPAAATSDVPRAVSPVEAISPKETALPTPETRPQTETSPPVLPVARMVTEPGSRELSLSQKAVPLRAPAPATRAVPPKRVVPEKKAVPPKEKVPFDEWLLSERNIKFALYGGGLLLFIAGIIFVGVNWDRIAGPVKFAITLMITGLTYLGGYLLYQRPAFRLGGVALIALACGFLTLNFAVLQIYVMGPEGLLPEVMWLMASPVCIIVYYLIASWTRHELFTYITIAALASLILAALVVVQAQNMVGVLAMALFGLGLLGVAFRVESSSLTDFLYRPALYVSHGVLPLALFASLQSKLSNETPASSRAAPTRGASRIPRLLRGR